ncbi:FecR domain-containing protein [Janthinobacterium sp. RB2R34]|uniref:FecR domain-containing protein n=1 Tax=Janthinobacterium sp. RB2R34 TaxID=3424193 RepID=UPI003F208A69
MSLVPADVDERHLEAAADWFVTLAEDGGADALRRWQLWIDAAPAHQQAWAKVERLQSLLAGAPLQAAHILRTPVHESRKRKPERQSRRQLMACIGVAFTTGMGWALLPAAPERAPIRWLASARGERRLVTLPDGARAWLGSNTRVGLDYDGDKRTIYLAQGVLQLTTGSDAKKRPLRIISRDGVVRPLGTRLTISQFAAHTMLTVQQHAAQVQTPGGPVVTVNAGQRVRFASSGCGRVQRSPVADDAWTKGLLMALDTPLPEFAAQFALHSGQAVEVAPLLASRRVSGTYQIDAPEVSLQTLAEVLAIRAERSGAGWRLRPR